MKSVLLAKPYDPSIDPTGYWCSEKIDGIRGIWTGKVLLTRNGNRIHAPSWFTDPLPAFQIDGELWAGRGNFQDATSIIRCASEDRGWSKLVYMVFDLPGPHFAAMPFEARQQYLADWTRHGARHVRFVRQTRCTGPAHLKEMMREVTKAGGEGLMLREPGSLYEHKRSSTLLKLKNFRDLEARVVGYIPGKGKHVGRLGALMVKLRNGIEFDVGTGFTDEEREHPPRKGAKVTVRYQELSRDGVPRFPVYVTTRDYE
jgi:DNA ligase-1